MKKDIRPNNRVDKGGDHSNNLHPERWIDDTLPAKQRCDRVIRRYYAHDESRSAAVRRWQFRDD